MPVNKNALIRYLALDACFRNTGRNYDIDDLVEACNNALDEFAQIKGVSKRQIYDDIRFMESSQGWSIPLERIKEGKKTYYRYSDTRFSINNFPLRPDELLKVKAAIEVLTRFVGLPQFEWVYEILPILNHKLKIVPSRPVIE
ncbi:MAG: WYL domain-containing protein, partial [Bacteroidales bacterium]|nr:WYL domain-containing protein [Bacteroidales bacterium]